MNSIGLGIRALISTHTPLAERDNSGQIMIVERIISTHTPLAERDADGKESGCCMENFYSHAPRGA